jgi:hypothetical protein
VARNAYRLGIDLGTSNTAAIVRESDGRTRPLLFDGAPLLPSAVCLEPSGQMLVGREAVHAARAYPDRFEPNPKQRVDEGTVLLGDSEVEVDALLAAILTRVAAEAARTLGEPPHEVRLTHPAAWGASRRAVLLSAAARAELGTPRLVPEPVAAATFFAEVVHARLPAGSCLVVYDFGAGTFDASVVRRTADGFEVLAADGLHDAGGLDIDAALLAHLGAVYSAHYVEAWRRLEEPTDSGSRRASRLLWDDVRTAKEMLSRTSSTFVHLPLIEQDAPLGREQLERLARPIVDRTVGATKAVIRNSGTSPESIVAVFLVGGSSRLPLAATLLHRALGIAPTAIEQPELVVAEGSIRGDDAPARTPAIGRARPVAVDEPAEPVSVPPAEPVSAPPAEPVSAPPAHHGSAPAPAPDKPREGSARVQVGLAGMILVALLFVVWYLRDPEVGNFISFGWETVRQSIAVLFVPAHVVWFAGVVLGWSGRPAALVARTAAHVLALAFGYVAVASLLRPLLDGYAGLRIVPVLAVMAAGIWLAIRAAARGADQDTPRPPVRLRRWLFQALGLGAAVGATLVAGGTGTAWYDLQSIALDIVSDPLMLVYYLPYTVGVAILPFASVLLGAGLAALLRGRPRAGLRRTLAIATGALLAAGGVALEVWQSGVLA